VTIIVVIMYRAVNDDTQSSTSSFKSLRVLNISAFAINFITAIVIFIITDPDGIVPLTNTVWKTNTTRFNLPEITVLSDCKIGYISGVYASVTAIHHLLVSYVFWGRYTRQVDNKVNMFRWCEYSITASLMHVQIALLSNITDVFSLICIVSLTVVTMAFGALFEHVASTSNTYLSILYIGFLPYLTVWTCIYTSIGLGATIAPAFVWAIINVVFFIELLFGVNALLYGYKVRTWKSYEHVEYMYIVLSLSAKQLLTWIYFGGSFSLN